RAARPGDVQEGVLPDDRVVALEYVLVVRVEPPAELIRIIEHTRMTQPVAVPLREAEPPAVFHRLEFGVGAGARQDPALTGEAERGKVRIRGLRRDVQHSGRGRIARI